MTGLSTLRTLKVSERGLSMPPSPIRKLAAYAEEAKRRGTKILHLNIGQPDIETPACMMARLRDVKEAVLEYSPSQGLPEFLESMAIYYQRTGIDVSPHEIIATTGGSEALLFSFMAVADVGDEMLVVEPFYANYRSFAEMAGVKLVPLRSYGESGFHLPPRSDWELKVSSRTRAVIICNPNNPTGTVYSRDELEVLASFCRDHNLFLISDEVYREFVYDGGVATSALNLEGMRDHVIVVDSLSKRYSACGIRLGAFVTRNRSLFEAAMRMAQARLSPPRLAQIIATSASELPDTYTSDVMNEYRQRRDVLYEELLKIPGVFLAKPEGAFYVVAKIPVHSSDDFARWLLTDFSRDQETVMVAPASGFYATPGLGEDEIRIAYVLRADRLRRAVELLGLALDEYKVTGGRR